MGTQRLIALCHKMRNLVVGFRRSSHACNVVFSLFRNCFILVLNVLDVNEISSLICFISSPIYRIYRLRELQPVKHAGMVASWFYRLECYRKKVKYCYLGNSTHQHCLCKLR